jgi:cytochrome c556
LDRCHRERPPVNQRFSSKGLILLAAAGISLAQAGAGLMAGAAPGIGGSGVLNASVPGTDPVAVIKTRQQRFKSLGAALKSIRDELHSGHPDSAKVAAAAAAIRKAADEIGSWFPSGTGPEAGVKTDAKPQVWSDGAGFAAARNAFVREAQRDAARFTDPSRQDSWESLTKSLGQSCKDCHDGYRARHLL